jgi:hypothetical protein
MHFVIACVKNYLRKVMEKVWRPTVAVAILRDACALPAQAPQDEG